jgi:hypothetical protein
MRRMYLGVAVCVLIWTALILALYAATAGAATPQTAARELARDYVAPLVAPDTRRVAVRVRYCRPPAQGWQGCRVVVSGAVTCRALVRVRVPVRLEYVGWVPRMRCS